RVSVHAEGGIRDRNVTGVQASALPIFLKRKWTRWRGAAKPRPLPLQERRVPHLRRAGDSRRRRRGLRADGEGGRLPRRVRDRRRSEERRGGEGCTAQAPRKRREERSVI